MADQTILVNVGANISNLTSAMTQASHSVSSFVNDTQKGFKAIGDVGKAITGMGLVVAGGLGLAVKTAAGFEQQMSKVKAISGATGKDFDNLTATAKKLGAETAWSAKQAGEGMEYLALAGWKANDIIAAMPGMLDLASAGALDLGRAADIVSDTMQAFGMKATEATHAADVFAYAQANANTNVEQLGEAMKYAAPMAHTYGWSIEQTSAGMMTLANSGIKGSLAGQAFASSLGRLAAPTKRMKKVLAATNMEFFDANEKLKPLPDVIAELEKATGKMTDKQKAATLSQLFGAEAFKHWAVLLDAGSDSLRNMTANLEKADGTAAKMAKTMLDNLNGQLTLLKSSLEGAAISIGSALIPAIRAMTKFINKLVDGFNSLSDGTKSFLAIGAAIAATLALFIGPLFILIGFIPALVEGFGAIAVALNMTTVALRGLVLTAFAWIAAIVLVVSALVIAYNECETFRNAVNAAWDWIVKATLATANAIKVAFGATVTWLVQKFGEIKVAGADAFSSISDWVSGAFTGTISAISSFFSGLNEKFGVVSKVVDYVKNSFATIGNAIATVSPLIARLALGFLGVTGPIGWIIAAAISLGATLYKLSKTNESVRAAFESVWNGIKTVFESVMSALQPVMGAFAQAFADLAPQFAETGRVIGESLATLGPAFAQLGPAFAGLFAALFPLIPTLMDVGKAIVGIYANVLPQLLSVAVQVFQGIFTVISTVLPVIINLISTIIPIVLKIVTTVLPLLAQIFGIVFQTIVSVIVAVMPIIIGLINAIIPVIMQIVSIVLPLLLSIVQAVFPVIMSIIQAVIPVIVAIINVAAGIITNVLVPAISFILKIVQAVFPVIVALITSALNIVMGVIKVVTGIIKGDWSAVWEGIKTIFKAVWEAIKVVVIGAVNVVKTIISGAWELIKGITSTVWNGIKSLFSSILSGIVSVVTSSFNALKSIISSVSNSIKGVIQTGWDAAVNFLKSIDLFQIGKNILQGLINGIKSMAGAIGSAVKGVAEAIPSKIKSFLGIHSPSRVLMELGEFTGEGFANGIKSMISNVKDVTSDLANAALPKQQTLSLAYDTPSMGAAAIQSMGSLDSSTQAAENNRPIYITNVFELDGVEVARVTEPYLDTMQSDKFNLRARMGGMKR